ncbi:MAG: NADPH:quinone oxidoreductase family protein [Halioglobus sp.]
MKALLCKEYGPPESLSINQVNDPVPGDDEVLVDVVAAGINFPDILTIAGKYQEKSHPPFVPGNELAGEISEIGKNVTRFAVGEKVIANTRGGAFAEKCVAHQDRVLHLPAEIGFEQGAGFSVTYGTSFHALRQRANLREGETVLVLGAAGGVGITAVEIAKSMGARVIAAASSDEKLSYAKSAGADDLVNYSSEPLKGRVRELTGGRGVDVVYDPVGGKLAVEALRATALNGRYLVVGFASGEIPNFPANLVLLKEASIKGVWWGPWALRSPELQKKNMDALLKDIKSGVLVPKIADSYAIANYQSAFAVIAERRARGKVILKFK